MSRLKNKLHEEIYDEARKIEKITEEVKRKCIVAVEKETLDRSCACCMDVIKAIQGV